MGDWVKILIEEQLNNNISRTEYIVGKLLKPH